MGVAICMTFALLQIFFVFDESTLLSYLNVNSSTVLCKKHVLSNNILYYNLLV